MWNLVQLIRRIIDPVAVVLMVILLLVVIPSFLVNVVGIDLRLSVIVALIVIGLYMVWAIPKPRMLFPVIFVSIPLATAITFWASSTAFTLGFILDCIVNVAVVSLVAAVVIFRAKILERVSRWIGRI